MAPGEHVAPNEPVTRRTTLWLSIRLGAENWLFQIEPDEDRAIVVGSLLRAHVRINRHDIAPVHFHFEREQDGILICPAYSADLCVNGTQIFGPHALEAHATIEFAGLELEAYVCDMEPNILEQLDLRDWTAEELPDCGGVLSLPDGAEVTRAIPRVSPAPEVGAGDTKKLVPLCDSYLQHVTGTNTSGADQVEVNDENASVTRESILPSPIVSVGTDQSETEAQLTPDCEPALPGVRITERVVAPGPPTSAPELSIDDFPSTAPVCSDSADDVIEPPSSLLTRIGLAALHRPVAATLAVACAAVVLSLAMLAVDGTMHHGARESRGASTSLTAPAVQLALPVPPSSEEIPTFSESEIAPLSATSGATQPTRRVPALAATGARAKKAAYPTPTPSTRAAEANPSVRSGL